MNRNPGRKAQQRAWRWVTQSAWPFWSANAADFAQGGFVERFSLDGRPQDPGFKRCRVTARQIYVFSHAAVLGFPGALQLAERGVDFLREKFQLPGGGWARRIATAGHVIDPTQDLYDLAFVLFALGWWARASGDRRAIDEARLTLEAARETLSRPAGGYLHVEGGAAPFEQNPHMHLFEAAVLLADVSKEEIFLDECTRILALAAERFVGDGEVLPEFYDADWHALGPEVRVEPGHHFEWAWLLHNFHVLSGNAQAKALGGRLFDFALRHGFCDKTGLVFDAVRPDGSALDGDHRIWPQLEAIKALTVHGRHDEVDRLLDATLATFLTPAHKGLWIDHVTAELRPRSDFAPTSTLYHVFLSFTEAT